MSELPLDDEQRAAVEAGERAIAVLAGPGSGKTRTLSYRARYLLGTQTSSRALLLTFTNKAAAEMKSRALGVSVTATDRIRAENFHSFAMRVLRAHGTHVGIQADFEVMDEDQQRQFAQATSVAGALVLLREWGGQRLRQVLPSKQVATFGEAYERAKRNEGLVDFDDLIVYTARLFQQQPQIAEAYATRYQHILIDEFQDTNAAQFAMVRALADHAATLSVFADDDQAIFAFAGAETRNIKRFCDDLQAAVYPLTTNYRSRDAIVQHANRLITANRSASGRQMTAVRAGGIVTVRSFPNVEAEALAICHEIAAKVQEGTPPASISVLVRSAFRVELLFKELMTRKIPISNWLGTAYRTQEQRAIRTCLAVARPTLPVQSRRSLCQLFDLENVDAKVTVEFLDAHSNHAGAKRLAELHRLVNSGASMSKVVAAVGECLATVDDTFAEAIASLVEDVLAFEAHDPEYALEQLLSELALGWKGGAPTATGGVKVATLHRTKGLQWPHVYLVGLEDGTLPDFRSTTPEGIQEERRLCFVGVCRAEDSLTLTRVREFKGYRKSPSPFLAEMTQ